MADEPPMSSKQTVAIIGAGFSGLLTALHLLSRADGPKVRLIERRGAFARGAAYSTLDEDHLLNVRASNMSAFPEAPDHFVDWLAARGEPGCKTLFVRRQQYGDYLQDLIQKAIESSPAGRFLLESDAAIDLTRENGAWRVLMAMGRSIDADAVVLAIGNLPPGDVPGFTPNALRSAAYLADPWSLDRERIPETGTALLIGSGLTMVDVAVYLAKRRPALDILALSRRGLLPRRHLVEGPAPIPRPSPEGASPLMVLRLLKEAARYDDWRAVLDGLRPHVHVLWRNWSLVERQRFLRHARPWWDIHRHRLSPPVAQKLDHLFASGRLRTAAGRIRSVDVADDAFDVIWSPRGEAKTVRTKASIIINCAGPNGDAMQAADLMMSNLVRRGFARPDVCRIGLDVDLDGRLIGASGEADPSLFAIGPITRGALWEITSVPDIRVQAKACGDFIAKALAAAAAT
jgi:uncharacterized NAD(P)/FAD-binding protein YdhS